MTMEMKRQPVSVLPNSKCEGCLNYNRDAGPYGTCDVGLQPFNCGDGSTPHIGYTPMASLTPHVPEAGAPNARAFTGADVDDVIVVVEQVLGDEAAQLVKSFAKRITDQMREECPRHRLVAESGTTSLSALHSAECMCHTVGAEEVVKAIVPTLQNRHRSLPVDAFTIFASEVLKADEVSASETIGKTRSGKPVLAPESAEMHKSLASSAAFVSRAMKVLGSYTSDDHYDAVLLHRHAAARHVSLGHKNAARLHQRMAEEHGHSFRGRLD